MISWWTLGRPILVNEQRAAADGLDTGYLRRAFPSRLREKWLCKSSPRVDSGRWLRRRRHQLCQPEEIVGRDSQHEHPVDPGKTTVIVLRKPAAALVQSNTSSTRLRTRPLAA
jgi:hypothetical protein